MRQCAMRQCYLGAMELAREDLLSLLQTEFSEFEEETSRHIKQILMSGVRNNELTDRNPPSERL